MSVNQFKPKLCSEWVLEKPSGESLAIGELMRLLAAVDELGHISGACQALGISYRHGWGVIRKAEAEFQLPLIETSRRKGSRLTGFAQRLLWANRRIAARLEPTFASLASELQAELQSWYTEDITGLRLHASHGFAVESLMKVAHEEGFTPLQLRYRTGIEALASLEREQCDLAGFQLPLGEYEIPSLQHYRHLLDSDRMLLIHLAVRNTGLFVLPGNPKNICCVADIARPDVRFVNRQIGSSTRFLVDLMLERSQVDPQDVVGYDTGEFTHMAVAAHIASGMADVGIGVETAAGRFGLEFIGLTKERYFFGINKHLMDTSPLQRLLDLMKGEPYRKYVQDLQGYDCSGMGQVQPLAEVLGPSQSMSLS
ncbi:MAG: substrate-binding domain-containing protein [Castellaniella sp.]